MSDAPEKPRQYLVPTCFTVDGVLLPVAVSVDEFEGVLATLGHLSILHRVDTQNDAGRISHLIVPVETDDTLH